MGSFFHRNRAEITARVALTIAALLPYWPLLSFRTIFVTDDFFSSDIFNGELPGRVLVADMIRHGEFPVWTSKLCSGLPLGGAPLDPIGLLSFVSLPTAAALDALVIAMLLVAAHGAYAFARRCGADRFGSVLCGLAFAGSGYIAAQLKHLSIISTVVWLPYGLTLIHRAVATGRDQNGPIDSRVRQLPTVLFGLVFANQALAGFPQSAYICGLVYAALAVTLLISGWLKVGTAATLRRGGSILGATLLGAGVGAIVLMPLSELGAVSDRAAGMGYEWSTILAYWVPSLATFLKPYIWGDISNATYIGNGIFWEDYGYVGIATAALALYAIAREKPRPILTFVTVTTIVAYLLVLGRATPVYWLAYHLLPGLSTFRFPTRFLIVVDLGLAVLAALALTRIRNDLRRSNGARIATVVAICFVAGTSFDLFIHQARQNPMVPAASWLKAPESAEAIRADNSHARTFTPGRMALHRRAFAAARGWTDVRPYFRMRELLEPNTGGAYWNIPSADCYAGIAPEWYVDTWGDHNREENTLIPATISVSAGTSRVHLDERLPRLLAAYGVTHVLTPNAQDVPGLVPLYENNDAHVYRVSGSARVRFVPRAVSVADDAAAVHRMLEPDFNSDNEVVIAKGAALPSFLVKEEIGQATDLGQARVVAESPEAVTVEVTAPTDGLLVLADSYYPGWTADVDGVAVPVYRANISNRAAPVSGGTHRVHFTFEVPNGKRSVVITALSLTMLLFWAAIAARPRTLRV